MKLGHVMLPLFISWKSVVAKFTSIGETVGKVDIFYMLQQIGFPGTLFVTYSALEHVQVVVVHCIALQELLDVT